MKYFTDKKVKADITPKGYEIECLHTMVKETEAVAPLRGSEPQGQDESPGVHFCCDPGLLLVPTLSLHLSFFSETDSRGPSG